MKWAARLVIVGWMRKIQTHIHGTPEKPQYDFDSALQLHNGWRMQLHNKSRSGHSNNRVFMRLTFGLV